jgi:putative phage-type endonuclease
MSALIEEKHLIQGTQEWLDFRKAHITATDATSIMEANPWKTKLKLYREKKSDEKPTPPNEAMLRGIELEPIARELFEHKMNMEFYPKVLIKDWAMASLDGINAAGDIILEIKCPGTKGHAIALQGKVPDQYYPQLQHQMYVADVNLAYFYSFDGMDGVSIPVPRDDDYIKEMVKRELEFYECLKNNVPPEPEENDYTFRQDDIWQNYASRWKSLTDQIKDLEKKEQEARQQLIVLAGQSNVKGAGISLSQVTRKGNVDYSKVPQLNGVNLDYYRKPASSSWRINSI